MTSKNVRKHTEPLNLLPLLHFCPGGVRKELAVCSSRRKSTNFKTNVPNPQKKYSTEIYAAGQLLLQQAHS